MKTILTAIAVISLLFSTRHIANAADAKAELDELVAKVNDRLTAAKNEGKEITEAYLADEMKQFDALLASHKGEKTNEVGMILYLKGLLYVELFNDMDTATEIMKQVKVDFPETKQAENADKIIAQIAVPAAADKIQKTLTPGKLFPDFDETDINGKPLSLASFKGKVVLVDFWATWCPPCLAELPNVLAVYEKYHGKGLEVIGISLDEDKGKLTSFIQEMKIPWQQYFDGLVWENKLAKKYGVRSAPTTYLLDKEGKIIAKDLRGEALRKEALELAVKKALGL